MALVAIRRADDVARRRLAACRNKVERGVVIVRAQVKLREVAAAVYAKPVRECRIETGCSSVLERVDVFAQGHRLQSPASVPGGLHGGSPASRCGVCFVARDIRKVLLLSLGNEG